MLDLKEVVHGLEPMLKRILGEDVRLVTWFAPDDVIVNADPGQLEQIVMNLAINARDAMPRGGRLTVHIARARLDEAFVRSHPGARAGAYALLEVSDEGTGMDPATLARIFEPFFTTKEVGRGTGLGLATVYGIVKQNDGYIDGRERARRGLDLQGLPARGGRQRAPRRWRTRRPSPPRPSGGAETILLLEDEDGLRAIAREILEEAGYRVLEARNVGEGVALASQPAASIDAILSDVVMPGASGPQGVALIRAIHPRIRDPLHVRLSRPGPARTAPLGPDDEMIEKPFTADALLRRVREVLDRALAPPRSALGDDLAEGVHDAEVPHPHRGFLAHQGERGVRRHRLAVRAVGGERVVHVGDGQAAQRPPGSGPPSARRDSRGRRAARGGRGSAPAAAPSCAAAGRSRSRSPGGASPPRTPRW